MSTSNSLYKLQSWLSPSYPVGAYSFSHGVENAVERGWVADVVSASGWIDDLLTRGNGFADLVFLREAQDACHDPERLKQVLEFALAFQTTSELRTETTAQGSAFLRVTGDAWYCDEIATLRAINGKACPYPVAVGVVAAGHGIDGRTTLTAYGHAFVANLASAAVRLIPLGQTDGQRIVAGLVDSVNAAIERALETSLHSVATATPMADITSMNHETQYTRLFRS